MTEDETVAMAREAGFKVENWLTNPPKPGLLYGSPEMLGKLLEMAVAAERERILALIESRIDYDEPTMNWSTRMIAYNEAVQDIAEAVRASS